MSTGKRIEFTIKRSEKDRRFYPHQEHGNGKTTWSAPHGRASLSSAESACDATWRSYCEQIDPDHVLQWPPTPYSKDSLRSRPRVSS